MSRMNRPLRCELAEGVAAPAHEADRAPFVADQDLGEVAPPGLGYVDLKALSLAGGREHQHLDLAGVADESGCGYGGEPATRNMGGRPAKA